MESKLNDWHFERQGANRTSGQPAPSMWAQALSSENVGAAWEKVRRNNGAPGVDGISIRDLSSCFALEWQNVRAAIMAGSWQPRPVRRVSVPKPTGGLRQLGIPTVMDRVLHQAVAQILAPLWEQRFSPHSFAYRPRMGVKEAMADLATQIHYHKSIQALHLDIEHFFDSVPHEQALRVVRRVANEGELVLLVQRVLRAGAFLDGRLVRIETGIPQGSPLSPLLANGVLHQIDVWLSGLEIPFVRYADDIVLLVGGEENAERLKQEVAGRLAKLGLRLNDDKTSVGPIADLTFLGFGLFQDSNGVWRRRIAPAAWAALEAELERRSSFSHACFCDDDGNAGDYYNGWLVHYGLTECPHDRAKLEILASTHGASRFVSIRQRPRLQMAYNGNGASRMKSPPRMKHVRQWPQNAKLWAARLIARRWVSFGLDWGRHSRPAIRVRLGPISFRFKL